MSVTRRTLLVAAASLVVGAGAISLGRPVRVRPAASVLDAGARNSVASRWRIRTDTVRRGELLSSVLTRAGVAPTEAARVIRSASRIDPRRIRSGTTVTTRLSPDSGASEIVFQLAIDRLLRLNRTDSTWTQREETLPWQVDTVVISGEVQTTLTAALQRGADAFPAGAREEVAFALADILEYRVDLSRDLRAGDSIRVLVERRRAPTGAVRPGQILAARLHVDGRTVDAVRFVGRGDRVAYLDGDGKSLRAAFLRAPLAFRRISSVFGRRLHPILGIWRAHQGTDYAAASGTPVRALGDGKVVFAGWKGGYGRVVEIRHRNGYVTRYGHLRGFAAGIRAGAAVAISRTIGFVGQTGLATAPHLHFEVLVGGVHRDPRAALRNMSGEPLAATDRAAFGNVKAELFAMLDGASNGVNSGAAAQSKARADITRPGDD